MRVFATLVLLAVGLVSIPAVLFAHTDPPIVTIPAFITITPDGGGGILSTNIVVLGPLGPIANSVVVIEFSAEATTLIAWSDPVPSGADTPVVTCPNRTYVGTTSTAGEAEFHIAGSGCVIEPDFSGASFICRVTVDQVLVAELGVNSPDVVSTSGLTCTQLDGPICDPDPGCAIGRMTVALSDAVYHSTAIKNGTYGKCSDLAPPYGGSIDLSDAVVISAYITSGSSACCSAGCP